MAKRIRLHDRSMGDVAGEIRLSILYGFIGPELRSQTRRYVSFDFCADANNFKKFSQSANRKHEEPILKILYLPLRVRRSYRNQLIYFQLLIDC